jgi:phosphoribosylanthranilate isomerase
VEAAAQIFAALPPFVTPLGVFVDSTVEHILDISGRLGLGHVQLHGDESPDVVAALGGLTVIKAIRVVPGWFVQSLDRFRGLPNLKGIVLETGGTREPGGTGVVNDWELIRKFQEGGAFEGLPPVIVAGGLNPGNVEGVIRLLRPWAVDVSSGVEIKRGEKSEGLVGEFIEAVRRADGEGY